MKKITYYFFRIMILLNKIFPFWLLYKISNLFYLLFFYVFKYRRKTVMKNLKNSFPEKSDKEIWEISKKFYRNFADIILESTKGFSMNIDKLVKRYRIINPEILDQYYKKGKSVIFVASHFSNWEWGVLCTGWQINHYAIGLYKPLSNKYMDKYMKFSRAAWGMNLESIYETTKTFDNNVNKPAGFIMLADQCPINYSKAIWMTFLNQETACLHGPEKHATRLDLPVIFCDIQRVNRGKYTVEFSLLEEHPARTSKGEITKKYMQRLEKSIIQKPENWLWTHRRWKRRKDGTRL